MFSLDYPTAHFVITKLCNDCSWFSGMMGSVVGRRCPECDGKLNWNMVDKLSWCIYIQEEF